MIYWRDKRNYHESHFCSLDYLLGVETIKELNSGFGFVICFYLIMCPFHLNFAWTVGHSRIAEIKQIPGYFYFPENKSLEVAGDNVEGVWLSFEIVHKKSHSSSGH